MPSFFGLTPEDLKGMSEEELEKLGKIQRYIADGGPSGWISYAEKLNEHALIVAKYDDSMTGEAILDKDGYIKSIKKYLGCSFSYMFLILLAIENLIKGLLIYHNPGLITSGTLNHQLKTHNLKTLHSYLKNKILNKGDLNLLEEIQTSINSRGRYPITLSYNDNPEVFYLTDESKILIDSIYSKLHSVLHSLLEKEVRDSNVGAMNYRETKDIDMKQNITTIFNQKK